MKYVLLLLIVFMSCGPRKPDYVDNYGNEYIIRKRCDSSHVESKFDYHYGMDFSGKMRWHLGPTTDRICDRTKIDTIEINLEQKYYGF